MKLQYYIVLWQHTLQKYRNGCCQECKYNETQYSKLTVKASKVSLSLPNVQTIDATVWRLRFGWTLWPASLMERSWLTTWSMTVALISLEHLTWMPHRGPSISTMASFLSWSVLAEVHTGPHWWQGETVHCRTDLTFLLYIETCHFDFLQYPM